MGYSTAVTGDYKYVQRSLADFILWFISNRSFYKVEYISMHNLTSADCTVWSTTKNFFRCAVVLVAFLPQLFEWCDVLYDVLERIVLSVAWNSSFAERFDGGPAALEKHANDTGGVPNLLNYVAKKDLIL